MRQVSANTLKSVCLYVYLSIFESVCLPPCLSLRLSACLCVCLSVCKQCGPGTVSRSTPLSSTPISTCWGRRQPASPTSGSLSTSTPTEPPGLPNQRRAGCGIVGTGSGRLSIFTAQGRPPHSASKRPWPTNTLNLCLTLTLTVSRAPLLRNSLPRHVREAGSVDAFKSMLKSFLFSKHYGSNLLSSFTI